MKGFFKKLTSLCLVIAMVMAMAPAIYVSADSEADAAMPIADAQEMEPLDSDNSADYALPDDNTPDMMGPALILKNVMDASEGTSVNAIDLATSFSFDLYLTCSGQPVSGEFTCSVRDMDADAPAQDSFSLTMTDGYGTVSIKPNQEVSVSGLNNDTEYAYVITAAACDGFTSEVAEGAAEGAFSDTAAITFKTIKKAPNPAYVSLDVQKSFILQNGSLSSTTGHNEKPQFNFTMTASGNNPSCDPLPGTRNASASFTDTGICSVSPALFPETAFSQTGTYKYTINETSYDYLSNIQYDDTIYNVYVDVKEDYSSANDLYTGNLKAAVTITDTKGNTYDAITFQNIYDESITSLTLRGTNHVLGSEYALGEYTFALTPVAGTTFPDPELRDMNELRANIGGNYAPAMDDDGAQDDQPTDDAQPSEQPDVGEQGGEAQDAPDVQDTPETPENTDQPAEPTDDPNQGEGSDSSGDVTEPGDGEDSGNEPSEPEVPEQPVEPSEPSDTPSETPQEPSAPPVTEQMPETPSGDSSAESSDAAVVSYRHANALTRPVKLNHANPISAHIMLASPDAETVMAAEGEQGPADAGEQVAESVEGPRTLALNEMPMPKNATVDANGTPVAYAKSSFSGEFVFGRIEFTSCGNYVYKITEVNDGRSDTIYDTSEIYVIVGVTRDLITGKFMKTVMLAADPQGTIILNDIKFNTAAVEYAETTPGEGEEVTEGTEITYEISYPNKNSADATVVITDELDAGLDFVSAEQGGIFDEAARTVTWNVGTVAAGESCKVSFTAKVNADAVNAWGYAEAEKYDGFDYRVVNRAVITLDNIPLTTKEIENPILEPDVIPQDTEPDPDQEQDTNDNLQVIPEATPEPTTPPPVRKAPHNVEMFPGDSETVTANQFITYDISWQNYMPEAANVLITEPLDPNVTFVSATGNGTYNEAAHTVSWAINDKASGEEGTASLTVCVSESAERAGLVKSQAFIKVADDQAYGTEILQNPLNTTANEAKGEQHKTETVPGEGIKVDVGQTITYEIAWNNYLFTLAEVTVRDSLDVGVDFVDASEKGVYDEATHTVIWELGQREAQSAGVVTLTVQANENALTKLLVGDQAFVRLNGGTEQATEAPSNPVNPPVPEVPHKVELSPGEGKTVSVGEYVSYSISWENYLPYASDIVIRDPLDSGVKFISASKGGEYDEESHMVVWQLKGQAAGTTGDVTVTVQVTDTAKKTFSIQNQAYVKVGTAPELGTEIPENPLPKPVPTDSPKTSDPWHLSLYIFLAVLFTSGFVMSGWNAKKRTHLKRNSK